MHHFISSLACIYGECDRKLMVSSFRWWPKFSLLSSTHLVVMHGRKFMWTNLRAKLFHYFLYPKGSKIWNLLNLKLVQSLVQLATGLVTVLRVHHAWYLGQVVKTDRLSLYNRLWVICLIFFSQFVTYISFMFHSHK